MLPKKLVFQSVRLLGTDGGRNVLSQVIVQSILITALDSGLHAAIGPKSLHGLETLHRERVIGPNVFSNQDNCLEPL